MIKELWTKIQRARSAKTSLVLFVPFKGMGENDAVGALCYKIIKGWRRHPFHAVIDGSMQHFDDVTKSVGLKTVPTKIAIFAHPLIGLNGFALDPPHGGAEAAILLRWWSQEGRTYDLILANVCRGAEILTRKAWSTTFPRWVSFSNELKQFLASSVGTSRWVRVSRATVDSVLSSSNVPALEWRLKGAYDKEIGDLWDSYEPKEGDALNLMYLVECHDSIVSRNEFHE